MTNLEKISHELFLASDRMSDFLRANLKSGNIVVDNQVLDRYYEVLDNLQESLMNYEYFCYDSEHD